MKTISRIAYSNDKKNKTRSILIMMSICLTTMLLVIISTVGNGMIRLQKSQAISTTDSSINALVVLPVPDTASNSGIPKLIAIEAQQITSKEGIEASAKTKSSV